MPAYEKVKELFQEYKVDYSEKEHSKEGNGTQVAQFHNLDEKCGAKALVVQLKKPDSYCLVVLPFDRNLDTKALQILMKAKGASFAKSDVSATLTGCESGAVPPFSFDYAKLPLVIDNAIKNHQKIFFNIGKLTNSVSLATADYLRMVPKAIFADVSRLKIATATPTQVLSKTQITPAQKQYEQIKGSTQAKKNPDIQKIQTTIARKM